MAVVSEEACKSARGEAQAGNGVQTYVRPSPCPPGCTGSGAGVGAGVVFRVLAVALGASRPRLLPTCDGGQRKHMLLRKGEKQMLKIIQLAVP